jgi:hypothetical protein
MVNMVIMDNPPANRRAMLMLEEEFTQLIGLGCQAHSLNLLCNDFNNEVKCPGTGALMKAVLMISLVIGDSEKLRTELHVFQVDKYVVIRAIASHVPTRFAITFKIAGDELATKDALRDLVESDEWEGLSASSVNAPGLKKHLSGGKHTPTLPHPPPPHPSSSSQQTPPRTMN